MTMTTGMRKKLNEALDSRKETTGCILLGKYPWGLIEFTGKNTSISIHFANKSPTQVPLKLAEE